MNEQHGFYYDQSRCSGCKTCVVACKDWNGVNPGPASWRRVTEIETGSFPATRSFQLSMGCNHCETPACAEVCPVDAISKRAEDGLVLVDRNLCIACHQCADACPFGAPQYGDDESEPVADEQWNDPHPMQKCTGCWDRLAIGKEPACVGSCLQRALDFGPISELRKKFPEATDTVLGFPADDISMDGEKIAATKPSILFKKK